MEEEVRKKHRCHAPSRVQSASHAGLCTCAMASVRKEGVTFHQLVAIVTEEGGAAHTINLIKICYNDWRLERGEQEVTASKWREMIEQKANRRKLWATFDMEHLVRRMWERFTLKKSLFQIGFGRCTK